MATEAPAVPDVFISYHDNDADWVETWLSPRLKQADLTPKEILIGESRLAWVQDAVEHSRRAIVVVTPDWLSDGWNLFEGAVFHMSDPSAVRRRMLPILLKPCDLPPFLAFREVANFTDERRQEAQMKRLIRSIRDTLPAPFPPTQPGGLRNTRLWRRWLYRYRQPILRSIPIGVVLWLVLAHILSLWPLERRMVWTPDDGARIEDAFVLHNTGASLIVGAYNDSSDCNPIRGLWHRPLTDAAWQPSELGQWLCFKRADGLKLSDIKAVASLPGQPATVYALTSDTGMIVSDDSGAHFRPHPAGAPIVASQAGAAGASGIQQRTSSGVVQDGLIIPNKPSLLALSGQPDAPNFWVAGERNGLFLYRDQRWQRLDAPGGCANMELAIKVTALLVAQQRVLIGSDQQGLWIADDSGRTCRRVFDSERRYTIRAVHDVSEADSPRYLALVIDKFAPDSDNQRWKLLDLCHIQAACADDRWTPESAPLWGATATIEDSIVQRTSAGAYEWFLVADSGVIWHGSLDGAPAQQYASLYRCYGLLTFCDPRFAADQAGRYPLLLADGHVYQYQEGPWWRRW